MDIKPRHRQMVKDESATLMRYILFCLKAAKISLIVGAAIFLAGGITGLYSVDLRKSVMSVSVYVLLLPLGLSMSSLKLSSSVDEKAYRGTPLDTSWRWRPYLMSAVGFVLLLAAAGYSV